MFHSSFAPPYVQYSIIPQQSSTNPSNRLSKMLNAPVPGIHGAKMMHDFGVSSTHTVIMDLPLSLDPVNQMKGLPPVAFDSEKPSRFGVFPRRLRFNDMCAFWSYKDWVSTVFPTMARDFNSVEVRGSGA